LVDRLSRELDGKLEAARMTAEALSLGAGLARDTVGRWIRGQTVPTLASLRAVEGVLGEQLGCPVVHGGAILRQVRLWRQVLRLGRSALYCWRCTGPRMASARFPAGGSG
jgi:transcriptional regulator with XRE-family HTH domain